MLNLFLKDASLSLLYLQTVVTLIVTARLCFMIFRLFFFSMLSLILSSQIRGKGCDFDVFKNEIYGKFCLTSRKIIHQRCF